MDTPQASSVKNLEHLYTTVVAVALSLSIYHLFDTSGGLVQFRVELLWCFAAFLITLIPFYHGALRHLDITYVENESKNLRKGALLFDFFMLFLESCAFIMLSVFLIQPMFFIWGMVALLVFDTIWAFLAYLGFSQDIHPKAEARWALINFVTSIGLTIYLISFNFLPTAEFSSNLKLAIGIPCILLLRTIVDYVWCWDVYYPQKQ